MPTRNWPRNAIASCTGYSVFVNATSSTLDGRASLQEEVTSRRECCEGAGARERSWQTWFSPYASSTRLTPMEGGWSPAGNPPRLSRNNTSEPFAKVECVWPTSLAPRDEPFRPLRVE